ncbi:MAG TPA: PEP-CTERM sorting domain-containing protein, partial [Candidatus Acidoferrales bacterium]|nr:PEP-CTERM sorting domain-containing protein [Candidatus Acidoferrales bacterium]
LSMLVPPMALIPSPADPLTPPTLAPDGPIDGLPSPLPPVYFPIVGGGGPTPPGSPPILPPPVSTPEPGTLPLLIAGFAALAVVYCRKSKLKLRESPNNSDL